MEIGIFLPLLWIFIASLICFTLISIYFYLSENLKRIKFLIFYYLCIIISTFIVYSYTFKKTNLYSEIINPFIGFISLLIILASTNFTFFKNKEEKIDKYLNTFDFTIPSLIYMLMIYLLGFYY